MGKKSIPITFRTTQELSDKLHKKAFQEERPVSYLVEKIVKENIDK